MIHPLKELDNYKLPRLVLSNRNSDAAILSYIDKVLSIQRANLIAYWPLNEISGTNINNAEGTSARDGTYIGVTLNNALAPDGQPAGFWDGINDVCDVYSADFASAWDGDEFTICSWVKVFDTNHWINDWYRWVLFLVDNDNYITLGTHATDGFASFDRRCQGAAKAVNYDMSSTLNWFHIAVTASMTNDELKAYIDGVQVGSTQTGLTAWSGSIDSTKAVIGADANNANKPHNGNIAHVAVWNTPLNATLIAKLATV